MRVWILLSGGAFFAVLTMCLAKAAVDGPSGWAGFGATIAGFATFFLIAIAADEARPS